MSARIENSNIASGRKSSSSRGAAECAYLTGRELATRLKKSQKWVEAMRLAGGGVPYHKFGSDVRYAIDDVEEYEARSRRLSTSDDGSNARR